jgi:hypothetical protein
VTKIVSRNEFSARTRDLVEEVINGQQSAASQKLKATPTDPSPLEGEGQGGGARTDA